MDDATAKELGLEALAVGFPRRPCPRGHHGVRSSDGALWRATMTATPWPDFRDPATLGVLLGQVRGAWGEPIHTAPCDDGAGGVYEWRAWPFADLSRYCAGPTEAHALVAALEAAPSTWPSNWRCPACGALHIEAPASFKCPCGTHRG